MKWIFQKTAIAVLVFASLPVFAQNIHSNTKAHIQPASGSHSFPQVNWVVSLGGGMAYPHYESSTMVANNSDFASPYNQDTYSIKNKNAPLLDVSIGRRFARVNTWLPSYTLGVSYQHLFREDVGQSVMLYSMPEFKNYTYTSYISSNVLLAFAKINVLNYKIVSPFFKVGLGQSYNLSSDYKEIALADVTARESAAFGNHTTSHFAYKLGAGADFALTDAFLFSIDYEYLNIGSIQSGKGAGSWYREKLNLGNYHANAVLFSLSYLI